MELINSSTRKTIKNMAVVSHCVRTLDLLPTNEDFAMKLIRNMRNVSKKVDNISLRIHDILDKYSSMSGEYLDVDYDKILKNIDSVSDYTKNGIISTSNVMTSLTNKTSKEITDALNNAMNTNASASIQIGGSSIYDVAMSSNLKLAMTGNGKREVTSYSKDLTKESTESVEKFFNKVGEGISDANKFIDDNSNLTEKNDNTKSDDIEDKIRRVKNTFEGFTKKFDDSFGFVNGKKFKDDGEFDFDTGEHNGDVANFIKNFNIGKVVTSIGDIVVDAKAATLSIDLLPSIDTNKMLKQVIGGVDDKNKNIELKDKKSNESESDLVEIPGVPWKLSKDDLEKYDSKQYDKFLEDFSEENDKTRTEILKNMQNARTRSDLNIIKKENKETKSALKSIRNIRRSVIKATQIEKYKGFLNIELEYLKNECLSMRNNIKNDWDSMMKQYKTAIDEIKTFFTVEGYGGNETIDKCCDKINDDAEQIVELCKSIATEMVNTSCMVGVPYSVGMCVDMPVHKVLAYIKDLQIILTFLKNLIRLGLDIISQVTILVKLIYIGLPELSDSLKKLKKIIGVDTILNMIDDLVAKIRPKMIEGKLLIENALSPIYYNETEDYERRVDAIEALLNDGVNGGYIEKFKHTDDVNAREKYRKKTYGGYKSEDDIEDVLEELESKGEREIVAYRSPLLNDSGDDFVGWIFYYANAYDDMKRTWSRRKKRKRNKVIKKASKKNKLRGGRLSGGVMDLRRNKSFGYYNTNGKYVGNSVSGFDAYYWYTKYTNDPMDCNPDFDNVEFVYDDDGNIISKNDNFKNNIVSPIQTTANGSLVELNDGRRVFVEGKIVKSGDFVNVDGVKYKVK